VIFLAGDAEREPLNCSAQNLADLDAEFGSTLAVLWMPPRDSRWEPPGYMARAIRQQKIAEIAKELGVNPGKIDAKDIVIARNLKALAAESLASTSRLGNFALVI
jgi:hypothetical protein